MRPLLCLLFALAVHFLPAEEAPITPKVRATAINAVPLEVRPGTNLQLIRARLDEVPCTLLFDTGATVTTFDRDFIVRAFPKKELRPVALGGPTNVTAAPVAFRIGALTLGNAELRDFVGMALPLGHLTKAAGTRVDGILGMNAMAYAPFVLAVGKGRVTWYPEGTQCPAGRPLPVSKESPMGLIALEARATPEGKAFPVLLDSGASLTVLGGALWPKREGSAVKLATANVNASGDATAQEGRPGDLLLGGFRLPVRPILGDMCGAYLLGADALRGAELLIDGKRRTVMARFPQAP